MHLDLETYFIKESAEKEIGFKALLEQMRIKWLHHFGQKTRVTISQNTKNKGGELSGIEKNV